EGLRELGGGEAGGLAEDLPQRPSPIGRSLGVLALRVSRLHEQSFALHCFIHSERLSGPATFEDRYSWASGAAPPRWPLSSGPPSGAAPSNSDPDPDSKSPSPSLPKSGASSRSS